MRIGGQRTNNCRLDAPGYGTMDIPIVTLGYGMNITAQVGESRRSRTFYPYIKTPGMWYIEAAFSDVDQRNVMHRWLISYIMRITDQWQDTLSPITVTVSSRSFIRTGYPTSSLQLGDSMGIGVYKTVVQFASAIDPLLVSTAGSKYASPTRDPAARAFYPADDQAHALPDPVYTSDRGADAVWSTGPTSPGGGSRVIQS